MVRACRRLRLAGAFERWRTCASALTTLENLHAFRTSMVTAHHTCLVERGLLHRAQKRLALNLLHVRSAEAANATFARQLTLVLDSAHEALQGQGSAGTAVATHCKALASLQPPAVVQGSMLRFLRPPRRAELPAPPQPAEAPVVAVSLAGD